MLRYARRDRLNGPRWMPCMLHRYFWFLEKATLIKLAVSIENAENVKVDAYDMNGSQRFGIVRWPLK